MSIPELMQLATLVSIVGGFIWNILRVRQAEATIELMRSNDIHDLVARLDRIEGKLDQHLLAHTSLRN